MSLPGEEVEWSPQRIRSVDQGLSQVELLSGLPGQVWPPVDSADRQICWGLSGFHCKQECSTLRSDYWVISDLSPFSVSI